MNQTIKIWLWKITTLSILLFCYFCLLFFDGSDIERTERGDK